MLKNLHMCNFCSTFAAVMYSLSSIRQPVEASWRQYERLMESSLRAENKLQQEVLRYVGLRRGKQIRPLLTLLSAQICNPVTDKTLRSAVALELLHTASLIHDDVVDSSDTRRGVEAVHVRWTNKVAVLIGDYMLAKVIGLVAEVRNIRILEIVSGLGKSLSSGEMVQLHAGQSMWIDEKRYFEVIEQKTAHLFRAYRDHLIVCHQLQNFFIAIVSAVIFTVFACQTGTDHDFHFSLFIFSSVGFYLFICRSPAASTAPFYKLLFTQQYLP